VAKKKRIYTGSEIGKSSRKGTRSKNRSPDALARAKFVLSSKKKCLKKSGLRRKGCVWGRGKFFGKLFKRIKGR